MFELSSTAFEPEATIPRAHTCDGDDRSPPLAWHGAPPGTAGYALICDDPDTPAGTWVHWLIWNVPGDGQGLPEGVPADETLSDGARQGQNDFRRIGYGGPCPPRGRPHRYFFKLYALDTTLDLAPGANKKQLLTAMQDHVLAEAELMGRYGRG
jgi:Raf kinase inhibitor-like YbhB/YbcL family protein